MSNFTKDTLIGFLIGAVIGFLGGSTIACLTCSCDSQSGQENIMACVLAFAIIGAVIGAIIGLMEDKEDEEREARRAAEEKEREARRAAEEKEREARRAAEKKEKEAAELARKRQRAYDNWCAELERYYTTIENGLSRASEEYPGNAYEVIQEMSIPSVEGRYQSFYALRKKQHYQFLIEQLATRMQKKNCRASCIYSLKTLKCLKEIDNKEKYNQSIVSMEKLVSDFYKPLMYLKEIEYGQFEFALNNEDEISYLDMNASKLLQELYERFLLLENTNAETYYASIEQCFQNDYLEKASRLLWYYAWKTPYDANRFEIIEEIYDSPTKIINDYTKTLVHVKSFELVLARIYNRNRMGGLSLVNKEMDYVNKWLQIHLEYKFNECCTLASAFAWMELYSLELEVLRKCVQYNIQLPENVQERLKFLESGGTSNVKVYEVNSSDEFLYDSSAVEWKSKDFEVLFRKATMKKLVLNYSFAIDKWTKTLPLASGQKVSAEALYHEFEMMVSDFDGEVSSKQLIAKAVDLENVEYENAVLFHFHNKRNRCGSILFSCEKFGRNLNLTIITMFTPEVGLNNEEHLKYINALKDNVYIDSFRESILQSVDAVLKERKEVYEDEGEVITRKIVE